jgi:Glycosyltransferase Family 4
MRIAQVSPLYESCPPQLCGGTERVVSYLTEELVRQGHDVTLFASRYPDVCDPAGTLRPGAAPKPPNAKTRSRIIWCC